MTAPPTSGGAAGSLGRRYLGVAVAIGAVSLLLCLGLAPAVVTSVASGLAGSAKFASTSCGEIGMARTDNVKVDGLSGEQVKNAATIISVGHELKLPPRGWVVAVATAMQESSLHNSSIATDHDSLGLFQQRPSTGWGTPEQILNPRYASAKFYQKLIQVRGWQQMRLADAAQAVQISAFPDRYQKWEPLATVLVNRLANGAANGVAGSSDGTINCALPGQVTGAGWTVPSAGPVGSGFRTPDRPTHNGVDVIVPRRTQIHAASAGIVITVKCNVNAGTCDEDGSPAIKGCGWYVEIAHSANLVTRYCHMVQRPFVTVGQRVAGGQVIGLSGTSGNSSGPHLHFEVHTGIPANNANAINPVPFMAARGAPLGDRR